MSAQLIIYKMEEKSKKEFTLTHRVLHWSVTVLMFVLFITGFLRMNWMARRVIQNAVTNNTQGLEISKAQMSGISKNIISPMWQWHVVAAYIMGGAFIIRLVYMGVAIYWTRKQTKRSAGDVSRQTFYL